MATRKPWGLQATCNRVQAVHKPFWGAPSINKSYPAPQYQKKTTCTSRIQSLETIHANIKPRFWRWVCKTGWMDYWNWQLSQCLPDIQVLVPTFPRAHPCRTHIKGALFLYSIIGCKSAKWTTNLWTSHFFPTLQICIPVRKQAIYCIVTTL